jgi:hypothetical protein
VEEAPWCPWSRTGMEMEGFWGGWERRRRGVGVVFEAEGKGGVVCMWELGTGKH